MYPILKSYQLQFYLDLGRFIVCLNFVFSEWLLFNANSAILQLYHGENKLIFNEMMMKSILYKTNTLSWIFYSAIETTVRG